MATRKQVLPIKSAKHELGYDMTRLDVDRDFRNGMFHRDRFAHYFRWVHAVKLLQKAKHWSILDIGCGTGNFLSVIHNNRRLKCCVDHYQGIDVNRNAIIAARKRFSDRSQHYLKTSFEVKDACEQEDIGQYDLITCFEVAEHVNKKNVSKLLKTIYNALNDDGIALVSTPNYNKKIGAAKNHLDSQGRVNELTYEEMSTKIISAGFRIQACYGTFARKADIKKLMNNATLSLFEELEKYYDTEMMSIMFAPIFPIASNNCLWKLSKEEE